MQKNEQPEIIFPTPEQTRARLAEHNKRSLHSLRERCCEALQLITTERVEVMVVPGTNSVVIAAVVAELVQLGYDTTSQYINGQAFIVITLRG